MSHIRHTGRFFAACHVRFDVRSEQSGVEESRQVDRLGAVCNAMHASVVRY